ncbi:MAG: CPBP family intramembrane metalloprotease [Gemmatimonadota bacterium]|jgi:membrane protease YdiL (CAAX protease family)
MKRTGPDHGTAADLPGTEPGTWLAPLYFLLYLAYLFWRQESELLHWASLVLLPFLLVFALHRRDGGSLRSSLGSLGIRRGNLRGGFRITLVLGIVLGCAQLLLSRSGPVVLDAVLTGRALYLFPLAFVLMLLTAGFTEEFFFRGFLQTRLESLTRSKGWGLVLASIAFGFYHLPYAYFNPHWPSAGDWGAALGASLGQGVPGGLILGGLFIFSRRNLVACVLLHALVDTFPAMGLIKFGG